MKRLLRMFEIKVFLSKDDVLVYSVKCQNYLYFQFPSVISHEFHTLLFWNMVTREIFSTLIFWFCGVDNIWQYLCFYYMRCQDTNIT